MNIEKNLDRLERQNADRPLALEQLRRIRENYRTILSDLRMIESMTIGGGSRTRGAASLGEGSRGLASVPQSFGSFTGDQDE